MTGLPPQLTETEISKYPELPDNFTDLIPAIADLIFTPLDAKTVDIVFVFGIWKQTNVAAAFLEGLFQQGISTRFILTGGIPNYNLYGTSDKSSAEMLYLMLSRDMQQSCEFQFQDQSTNSLEDVALSSSMLSNHQHGTVGCAARSWAFLRQYLTLCRFLPQAHIVHLPYDDITDDGSPVTKDTWHLNEVYKKRVWGEVLRLDLYGCRGDIAYPQIIRNKVDDLLAKATY